MTMKIFFSALFLATVFLACKKDAAIDAREEVAYTMFYNGSIDFYATTSKLLINNSEMAQLTYNGYRQQPIGAFNYAHYTKMHPGTYLVSFTDSASKPNKITSKVYDLKALHRQTVYLVDSAGYYETIISDDDVVRDAEYATIRLIHLSQDAGPVKLFINTDEIVSAAGLNFRQVSAFVKVKPDLKPGIRVARMVQGIEQTLIRKSFAFEAGKCYTLVLRGAVDPADANLNKTIDLSGIINL